MYYEIPDLLFKDLEEGVKDNLLEYSNAYMAMVDRSKSFKVFQYMKKKFPYCIVERKFDSNVYLISIRENYEKV